MGPLKRPKPLNKGSDKSFVTFMRKGMNLFKSPGLNSAENIMHNMHKSLIKKELLAMVGNSAIH